VHEKPDPCFGHIPYFNGALTLYAFNLHRYATGLILFHYFSFENSHLVLSYLTMITSRRIVFWGPYYTQGFIA
jgi:hypothetical protein